jgi:uncharacterized protein
MANFALSKLDFLIVGFSLSSLYWLYRCLRQNQFFTKRTRARLLNWSFALLASLVILSLFCAPALDWTPTLLGEWTQAIGISIGILSSTGALIHWLRRKTLSAASRVFAPERREFLEKTTRIAYLAPTAFIGYGTFVEREKFLVREVPIKIPNLPKDLQGIRIAQLTDIHMSAFFSGKDLSRAVAMANETKPHVAVMTGDLITRTGDPLDACLDGLKMLRSDAGIFGCLGNHEIYAQAEDYAAREAVKRGVFFLRRQNADLSFGSAHLNLLGFDYQRNRLPMLVGAERLLSRNANAVNILLSHNPNAFDRAASLGIDLTVAGHTHGGQVTLEVLEHSVNVARFVTNYVRGSYQNGKSALYVSPGLGTVGVPIRLQVPPEITVLTLCAI